VKFLYGLLLLAWVAAVGCAAPARPAVPTIGAGPATVATTTATVIPPTVAPVTNTPAPPSPTPTSIAIPRLVSADGAGLYLRPAPNATGAARLLPDGAPLVISGAAQTVNGVAWVPVQTADGADGWVAAQYLTVPPASAATPTTVPSRTPTSVPSSTPRPTATPVSVVARPPAAVSAAIPVGASAVCVDGTYSFSQNRRGTCSHHGGVSRWL
jgi:hypothetical protein